MDLKYGTNESNYKTETDVENGLAVAEGEGDGEGWPGSLGVVEANYYI